MKQHIQTLINLLSEDDDNALQQHYRISNESENVAQLAYLFQQGMGELSKFEFYQQLTTTLIANKCLPVALIAQIKTSDTLSFFTPALQLEENFKRVDHLQRNALHYLLAGDQSRASQPPFNYLRSMMLFESNGTLRDALCQRDLQNLTPIELYLFSNQDFKKLPPHELTALLALIEIESKQQSVDETNYLPIIQAVSKLCHSQVQQISTELQRLMLIAIYFTKSINDIVNDIN